jgi:hypothetical protein
MQFPPLVTGSYIRSDLTVPEPYKAAPIRRVEPLARSESGKARRLSRDRRRQGSQGGLDMQEPYGATNPVAGHLFSVPTCAWGSGADRLNTTGTAAMPSVYPVKRPQRDGLVAALQ